MVELVQQFEKEASIMLTLLHDPAHASPNAPHVRPNNEKKSDTASGASVGS